MVKKPVDANCSALTEELRQILKLLNLKLVTELGLLNTRILLAKVSPKIGREKYFFIDSVLKTNPLIYKIKDLNR